MKVTWCTDIHLDNLDVPQIVGLCKRIDADGDGPVFITGDISTGNELPTHLDILGTNISRPVYFVLGNHDFYSSDVVSSRQIATNSSNKHGVLNYLTTSELKCLSPSTAIVGHDGWYDAGYGDPSRTNIVMADWIYIHDFISAGAATRFSTGVRPNYGVVVALARKFAAEAAQSVFDRCVQAAHEGFQEVIVLTHVPPFHEAHFHRGAPGDPSTMPWYTSRIFGDAMRQVSKAYPDVNFLVLSGHTHGQADVRISHNLRCMVGGSEYGDPRICGSFEVR